MELTELIQLIVPFVIAAIIGFIPAKIAFDKGKSFKLWWFFGFMFWIIAFPVSMLINKDEKAIAIREGTSKCPKCMEWGIKKEATVCKYCGSQAITV